MIRFAKHDRRKPGRLSCRSPLGAPHCLCGLELGDEGDREYTGVSLAEDNERLDDAWVLSF